MIELEPLYEAKVTAATPKDVGMTPDGHRRVIDVTGGTFEGPRMKGRILPGGADFQIVRTDGSAFLDARYTFETDDGALIYVTNQGYRHGPADIIQRITEGEDVDPSLYYFRTAFRFETGAEKYDWLNRIIAVGSGHRHPDSVTMNVYEVK